VQCILTTHFREVFDFKLLGDDMGKPTTTLGFYHMNVLLDAKTGMDEVVPLFKLAPGLSSGSYGLACAQRAGIPQRLVSRAAAVTAMLKSKQQLNPCEWVSSGGTGGGNLNGTDALLVDGNLSKLISALLEETAEIEDKQQQGELVMAKLEQLLF
jgi:DNA mismatch repair ATPase MutS